MRWFRLWNEFAHDAKVQSMPEVMQRRLIMLFCMRSEEHKLSEEEMCVFMRISQPELLETMELFERKGFIDKKGNLRNWDKRQYKSDNSTTRWEKWKERQQKNEATNVGATFDQRLSNDIPTLPDTDTDTENTSETFTSVHVSLPPDPSVKGRGEAAKKPKAPALDWNVEEYWKGITNEDIDEWQRVFPACRVGVELDKMSLWLKANPGKAAKRNWRRFILNWLTKQQDRGGTRDGKGDLFRRG